MKRILFKFIVVSAMLLAILPVGAAGKTGTVNLNVVLKTDVTAEVLKVLKGHGTVLTVFEELDALTMKVRADKVSAIAALPFVESVGEDAERNGAPIDTVGLTDFSGGYGTWNLDVINVTNPGPNNRTVAYDGTGVYVAVLDTGLHDSWRKYFPQERIAVEYAASFGGGAGLAGTVSFQPNKWEHDQNGHGTHVTSTILGYNLRGTPINGVAPNVTIIPVKVLNQNGSGWSSVISMGITYIANLKKGVLKDYPVVINMSLGGSALDPIEKEAIDYAIEAGVIIVASAGNNGDRGMGYPGAYEPVISVAASGWIGEWYPGIGGSWWNSLNVSEPTSISQMYITEFSSRAKEGQDLDVAAPGSWIVGPYQVNSGNRTSFYFLGGTSMAAPHVAGIVALMAQKYPALTPLQAETILQDAAIPMEAGSRNVFQPNGTVKTITWGADATGHGLITADAALGLTP
ncbi:MAG: Subtilisin DY [Firmicutes bacterium HGW-Firmicutes-19]|jgi:subtilisin family serine protease|nr:MAG: Subtilisin DY [Firmicutes bacterium HGW-Firmicutes-19]